MSAARIEFRTSILRPPSRAVDELDVLDQLGELMNNSMVTTDHSGDDIRYRLFETMRDYASLRLEESGDASDVRERHGTFFAHLAGTLYDVMWSDRALGELDRCRLEMADLRRAFEQFLDLRPVFGAHHGDRPIRVVAYSRSCL